MVSTLETFNGWNEECARSKLLIDVDYWYIGILLVELFAWYVYGAHKRTVQQWAHNQMPHDFACFLS